MDGGISHATVTEPLLKFMMIIFEAVNVEKMIYLHYHGMIKTSTK